MIDVLSPVRDRLGESPLWSVADQVLWWVDMCSFGGPDMQSLCITSLQRPPEPPHGNDALAGAVFVTRPGATGIAETPFNS